MKKSLLSAVAVLGLVGTANADLTANTKQAVNATGGITGDLGKISADGIEATGRGIYNGVIKPVGQTAEGSYVYVLKPMGQATADAAIEAGKATANAAEVTGNGITAAGKFSYEQILTPVGQATAEAAGATADGVTAAGKFSYEEILTPTGHAAVEVYGAAVDLSEASYQEVLLPLGQGTADAANFVVVKASDAGKYLYKQSVNGVKFSWNEVLVPVGNVTKEGVLLVAVPTADFVKATGSAAFNLSGDMSAISADAGSASINSSREVIGLNPVLKTNRAAKRAAKRDALKGN